MVKDYYFTKEGFLSGSLWVLTWLKFREPLFWPCRSRVAHSTKRASWNWGATPATAATCTTVRGNASQHVQLKTFSMQPSPFSNQNVHLSALLLAARSRDTHRKCKADMDRVKFCFQLYWQLVISNLGLFCNIINSPKQEDCFQILTFNRVPLQLIADSWMLGRLTKEVEWEQVISLDVNLSPPARSTTHSTMSSPESAAAGTSSTCTVSCGPQWCSTWSACSWESLLPPSWERTRIWWVQNVFNFYTGDRSEWEKVTGNSKARFKGSLSLLTIKCFTFEGFSLNSWLQTWDFS